MKGFSKPSILLKEWDKVIAKEIEWGEKMMLGKRIAAFLTNMLMVCLVGNLFLIENYI